MKSLHEVVVRNRLEQLRKLQRDEALQAQEELLAGVAHLALRGGEGVRFVAVPSSEPDVPAKDVEPYDRSMSPPLIDITGMSTEERENDVITEKDQLQALVCDHSFSMQ